MASDQYKKYDYVVGELLGTGAFGSVHLVYNKVFPPYKAAMKTTYKLKHLPIHYNEWKILRHLDDDNIIKVIDMDPVLERKLYLEYCEFGSLDNIYFKTGRFENWQLQLVATDVLRGLEYLHAHRIVHRDIKGPNILVDSKGYMKISDFGFAFQLTDADNSLKDVVGTRLWMAPEVRRNRWTESRYNEKCDIYSFGCTMIEVSIGQVPDYGMNFDELSHYKYPPLYHYSYLWSVDFHNFIKNALFGDYFLRPPAKQLMTHPFLGLTNFIVEEQRKRFLNEVLKMMSSIQPSIPECIKVLGFPSGYSKFDKIRRKLKQLYNSDNDLYPIYERPNDNEEDA